MISKKNKSGTLSIPLTTTQTHPDKYFPTLGVSWFLFRSTFYFFITKAKRSTKIVFFWWRIHRMTSLLLIFIWNLLLPLKACFFHYVSYYSSASWHEIIHTYWMVLRGNAVYRRIRKWRSVFILAVWGRIMYLPGLSFIVLRTCWKFCSNVSPISSISIPCFCCLAYKIKLPIFCT